MVEKQLVARDITHEAVLTAMRAIPRHLFVAEQAWGEAYEDHPLKIGHGQTISQPYIVALMSQLLAERAKKGAKVLEVGSGSGYQTAILVHMGFEVTAVELIPELLESSRATLTSLDLLPTNLVCKDGHEGVPEFALYDAVLSAACAKRLPRAWVDQLSEGGVVISPIKSGKGQDLCIWVKHDGKVTSEVVTQVLFVPLLSAGEEGEQIFSSHQTSADANGIFTRLKRFS